MGRSRGFWILLVAIASCVAIVIVALSLKRSYLSRSSQSSPSPNSRGFLAPIPAGASDLFADVTEASGIAFVHQLADGKLSNIMESNGAGGAVLDYDQDGWMDIYFVNSGPARGITEKASTHQRWPNRLYRNRGDGTFEDVTARAGVEGSGFGSSAVAADYDNDGFTDLFVVNSGQCILYRNTGKGTFDDVTARAGITTTGTGFAATFFDAERDGDLDLFIVNYLTFDPKYKLHYNPDVYPGPLAYKSEFNVFYRNRGDGTFEDASETSGIRLPGHRGMSVTAYDYDVDGDADLYISNDASPNVLLANDGKGNFRDVGMKAGVAFNQMGEAAGSMAAAVGDCNGDGYMDMLVTRFGYGSLYMGSKTGQFDDAIMASGVGPLTAQFVAWGGNLFDFDNDGDLDAFISNGDPHYMVGWESLLLENRGDGRFTDAAAKGGQYFKTKVTGRGSATADFDNDGDLDVLVCTLGNRPMLLRNRSAGGQHWLTLDLRGTRSNRDAFGAKLTLEFPGRTVHREAHCPVGYQMQSDRRLHFGLGALARVDRIRIQWPSGSTQVIENVAANEIVRVVEPDPSQARAQ